MSGTKRGDFAESFRDNNFHVLARALQMSGSPSGRAFLLSEEDEMTRILENLTLWLLRKRRERDDREQAIRALARMNRAA